MEILIGREVTGTNDIVVPQEYNTISRKHAKINISEEGILIQDLDSANGTYVNNEPIISKYITANDKVVLGKEKVFEVNLSQLITNYNNIFNHDKIDYIKEFEKLGVDYEKYLDKLDKLDNKVRNKMMIVRMIIMILIFLIYKYRVTDKNFQIPMLLSIVSSFLADNFFHFSKDKRKITNLKIELTNEFEEKYICPKCRGKLDGPWLKLKLKKKCHKLDQNNNICGAIYSK